MQVHTIRRVLRTEISNWIETIQDKNLQELLKQDVFIAGGCIVSMLLGEKIRDFDIFLRSRKTVKALINYYIQNLKDHVCLLTKEDDRSDFLVKYGDTKTAQIAGIVDSLKVDDLKLFIFNNLDYIHLPSSKEQSKYSLRFVTKNAFTLSQKLQCVIGFWGGPQKMVENFDFWHCRNYYEYSTNKLVLQPQAIESILTKELKYVGSHFPLNSLLRTRKFISRGWTIHVSQYLKMVLQISQYDLLNTDVLREQLVGVDPVYMDRFISHLSETLKESTDIISVPYVVELIDNLLENYFEWEM